MYMYTSVIPYSLSSKTVFSGLEDPTSVVEIESVWLNSMCVSKINPPANHEEWS